MAELIKQKEIQDKIYSIRGEQVMLDRDLAKLYQVKTKVLNQAVKRNLERFYVSINKRRVWKLEVTNCDLQ